MELSCEVPVVRMHITATKSIELIVTDPALDVWINHSHCSNGLHVFGNSIVNTVSNPFDKYFFNSNYIEEYTDQCFLTVLF